MHGRTDDALKVIAGGWFQALRTAPFKRHVATMAGLRIEGQYLFAQPLAQPLKVSSIGRPEIKKNTDGASMSLPLAAAKHIRGQHFRRRMELHGQPLCGVWVDFIVTLRKSAVQLHKLELDRETEPAFIGHAWQQRSLLSSKSP